MALVWSACHSLGPPSQLVRFGDPRTGLGITLGLGIGLVIGINCMFGYGEPKPRLLTVAMVAPVYRGPELALFRVFAIGE